MNEKRSGMLQETEQNIIGLRLFNQMFHLFDGNV